MDIRPGGRLSAIDRMLRRFQERWETNPQYRAATSGVLSLVVILVLCSCTGLVTTVVGTALASVGVGGAGSASQSGNTNTGTSQITGYKTFAVPTPPTVSSSGIPAVNPIPNSQTPVPVATPTPAATPTPSTGPTPTAGAVPTTCNGASGGGTWSLSPCPQVHGQGGTLYVSVPGHGGASANIILNFGSCSGCTMLFTPSNYSLDGSGNLSISYTVPQKAANSTVPISGFIKIGGGPTMSISAAPVQ